MAARHTARRRWPERATISTNRWNRLTWGNDTVASQAGEKLSIRINADDRHFLDDECLRIMQDRFTRTRRLRQPSLGDVISELLGELRSLRGQLDACTCDAGDELEPVAPSALDRT